jgi:hypothetical protein
MLSSSAQDTKFTIWCNFPVSFFEIPFSKQCKVYASGSNYSVSAITLSESRLKIRLKLFYLSPVFRVQMWRDPYIYIQVVQLKVYRLLILVMYLLRFTAHYITQLTCHYSKCWKLCPFISMHLSTRFTMFLATFLRVLSFTFLMEFFNHFRNNTFYWRLPSKFFQKNFVCSGFKTSFSNNFPK